MTKKTTSSISATTTNTTTRVCRKCKDELPIEQFYRIPGGETRRKACKLCHNLPNSQQRKRRKFIDLTEGAGTYNKRKIKSKNRKKSRTKETRRKFSLKAQNALKEGDIYH